MATFKRQYSAQTKLTVTNLNALADAAYWQSDEIDNSSLGYLDIDVEVQIRTTTTVGSATGYVNVYLAGSQDNTDFDGLVTGAEGTFAVAPGAAVRVPNMKGPFKMRVPADAATAYTFIARFSVNAAFGHVPKYVVVVVQNATGAALGAASNEVNWMGEYVVSA